MRGRGVAVALRLLRRACDRLRRKCVANGRVLTPLPALPQGKSVVQGVKDQREQDLARQKAAEEEAKAEAKRAQQQARLDAKLLREQQRQERLAARGRR